MKASKRIKKCKKCGILFFCNESNAYELDKGTCSLCKDDNWVDTAVLFARVIEKMMRE